MGQANRASVSYEPLTEGEREGIQRQVRQYLDGSLADIEVKIIHIKSHISHMFPYRLLMCVR